MKEKAERNKLIYETFKNRPDLKYRELSEIFNISIPRLWLIVQIEKRKEK